MAYTILSIMVGYQTTNQGDFQTASFRAMASPCEVIVESLSPSVIHTAGKTALSEAPRVERCFSRYRDDNIVFNINNSQGQPIKVDEETANLLDFADQCYTLSDGLFDITSGVLRRAWSFDNNAKLPLQGDIEPLLALVGWVKVSWEKVSWHRPRLVLPAGPVRGSRIRKKE